MRIAFVTCAALPHGRADDAPAAALIGAEFLIWDDPSVDWGAYDRVVIRSAWDYTQRYVEFTRWCEQVGPERLRNRPDLVVFNSDKLYLRQLSVPTVPTEFLAPTDPLPSLEREVVIKPSVSAGGRHTGRFMPHAADAAAELLAQIHASGRAALVQPYLPGVDQQGETAVVLFGGKVSHALHKKPVLRAPGVAPLSDQGHGPAAVMFEEDLVTATTATPAQLALARAACDELSARFGAPVYLRVDMVPGPGGDPVVMELEAIEPALYLGQSAGAAERFAQAIIAA